MKIHTKNLILLIVYFVSSSTSGVLGIQALNKKAEIGEGLWDASTLGNHRAVVRVTQKADAVWAHIPWRRRDPDPEKKKIIVIDAESGDEIKNLYRVQVEQEFGDLVFQPRSVPGEYFIYFMPYKMTGQRFYPALSYLKPEETSDTEWRRKNGLDSKNKVHENKGNFPEAEVIAIQSINEFHSFSPMEIIATEPELNELLVQNAKSEYILFPEDRKYPIRMSEHLPLKWIQSGPQKTFVGEAVRGEFYVFQIGIYAVSRSIKNLKLEFDDLKIPGFKIPSSAFNCFNTEREDPYSLDKGRIGALWCGVQIPKNAKPGKYEGKVTILPEEMGKSRVQIQLNVTDIELEDKGDSEPWRHSHLRWLDSDIAQNKETVEPFPPLHVEGNTVKCLGRSVTLDTSGFPKNIQSFFAMDMTRIDTQAREFLTSPIKLAVETLETGRMSWENRGFKFIRTDDDIANWESQNQVDALRIICRGQMEFDGYLDYQIVITAKEDVNIKDIHLEIPLSQEVAKYMMGMGLKGGTRPSEYKWNWDPYKNQNSIWIGDINAGIQLKLKKIDPSQSHLLPDSWYNEGNGGCVFGEIDEDTFLIKAYTGSRVLRSGEEMKLCFHLLITPFKTLDLSSHWKTRFIHRSLRVGLVSRIGANIIDLPQSSSLTPYISYPFLNTERLKDYVGQAHSNNLKVMVEYTGNQLTNHAPEIFALESLGKEVFKAGQGGGVSWLQEHLGSGYKAGRYVPIRDDATIQTAPHTRWYNYYLESIDWMMKNLKIDGVSLDDPLFDRQTMKRLRKILDRDREGTLIDLHAANKWTKDNGFANNANLYLELLPYTDRLWFGKNYDYNEAPDYWLIEVSGIPFGLIGDIFQVGDSSWHGMLYGMTPRHSPGSGNPKELWRIWDKFGIQDAKMFGYWMPDAPIKSDHMDVPATVYLKKDKALIVLASWADETVSLKLHYDWEALGMSAEDTELYIPPLDNLQDEFTFSDPTESINVRSRRGWLLYLRKKTQ